MFQVLKRKIHNAIGRIRMRCQLLTCSSRHARIVKKLRKKSRINVGFYAIYPSIWKYDLLYKLLSGSGRFNPVVVICPAVHMGPDHMMENIRACRELFESKGYNVVSAYDEQTGEFLDVKKMLGLDVIFYTNPYSGLIHNRYYITNSSDVLTCYVPYNFGNSSDYQMFSNLPLHNLVWRMYLETEAHRQYSVEHARNAGSNVCVTGYPGIDPLIEGKVKSYPWKQDAPQKKRIIWAPHHTVKPAGMVFYSCFLQYADFMLEMAQKYADKVQIAFKPHPLLRVKLNEIWGKERTDSYFGKWESLPNCIYTEGEYIDLFLTSDAMIHDSGSFLIEYLYTGKPIMRTSNGQDLTKLLNPFALDCLGVSYQAASEREVEDFIVNVINGVDEMAEVRADFVKTRLMPPGGVTASQNIFDDLSRSLS